MNTVMLEKKNNKIHPHKFTLWVGIGSILMMFAGLTSAYVVKRNQANWSSFEIPMLFWISTIAILLSSFTLYLATKSFKERMMSRYRYLMATTLFLGVVFIAMQVFGFIQITKPGLRIYRFRI